MNKKTQKNSIKKSVKTTNPTKINRLEKLSLDEVSQSCKQNGDEITNGDLFAASLKGQLQNKEDLCSVYIHENELNQPITPEGHIEKIIKDRDNERRKMTEEERVVLLDRAQRLGVEKIDPYLKEHGFSFEDLKDPINPELPKEPNKSDIDEPFIKQIIKSDEEKTLPILDSALTTMQKERLEKRKYRQEHPISEVVNGVIKVKRPIGVYIKNKPDIESKEADRIRENYGQDNYSQSVSLANQVYSGNFQQIDLGIPDVNIKIMEDYDSSVIQESKDFCETNKEEMKHQMNVVAFYSIKDSKPFYYVSSAEARLAIDYITLCRKYKKDIFKFNSETIKEYVQNVHALIGETIGKSPVNSKALVWKSVYENLLDDDDSSHYKFIENYTNIKSIYKSVFIPNSNVTFNRFEIEVNSLNVKSLQSIIDLHEPLNFINGFSSFIVMNTDLSLDLIRDLESPTVSFQQANKNKANTTEREIYGMVAKYKGKPIFINEAIGKDKLVIVSRRVESGEVIISEYEIKQ